MNKTIGLVAASFVLVLMGSCGQNFPGYEENENGLHYKFFYKSEDGAKPQIGDYVVLSLLNKFNDSVIYDSRKVNPEKGVAQYYIEEARFKGALEEGLMMMSVGDSASFIISADSVLKYFPSDDSTDIYPKGSMLTFNIKLVQIRSKAEVQAERDSLYNEYMKAQSEMFKARKEEEKKQIAEYLKTNKVTVKPTASGIYYEEKRKGSGASPRIGDKVLVNYTGKFLDGNIFDSSENAGKPVEFMVDSTPGKGVIPGWVEVLQKMKAGGKATVLIPSSMAYDSTGVQDPYSGQYMIMPFTPLLFEIELVEVSK
ncbi:MAG: FKBP-type peptidyl-prolyl cis-trans isomerase [Bacteroidota bacterium]